MILDSCANRESRTSYGESRRASSLAGQKLKDSPMTDLSIIFQRHTVVTQLGMATFAQATDCMLKTRPIQVIKRMFLLGHLYHASFPQLKFQIPAPNANKQCITHVQGTACLFWAYTATWLDKDQL